MAEFVKPNVKIVDDEEVKPDEVKPDEVKPDEVKPDQIKANDKKKVEDKVEKKQNICVVSIRNSNPYDSSELPNNATTYYVNITYNQLKELYHVLKTDSDTTNMVYKNISNYVKDSKTKVFFDFKCSSDCHSGTHFVDSNTTLLVFKLINTMTRKGCDIVVGDHSMGALFNNWDKYRMDYKSPITICDQTTDGPFKMTGLKQDFINSDHPILKDLGDMSSSDSVDIEFVNMSGTKIFSVKPESAVRVQIISKGKPLGSRSLRDINTEQEQPVHCEFKYRNGMIIVSSTHWCNLTNVNSQVDVEKVREQYTQRYGAMARQQFEAEYQEAVMSGCTKTVNRVVSDSVKFICSNTATPSKSNYQQKIIDNLKNQSQQPQKVQQVQQPQKVQQVQQTSKTLKSLNINQEPKTSDNNELEKVLEQILPIQQANQNEDNKKESPFLKFEKFDELI